MRDGQILVRTAVPEQVRFDRREIDVMAVPYDTPTEVADGITSYTETIAPGAFGRVSRRARQVKVLRDHHPHRAIGYCNTIDDQRSDGLHATLHITPIPLGDETLALAADGVLDVSIGFSSQGGDRWAPDHSSVVRTNLRLWEMSLVPLPAYESARVLAVRHLQDFPPEQPEESGTPYLDEVRAWLFELKYSSNPIDSIR